MPLWGIPGIDDDRLQTITMAVEWSGILANTVEVLAQGLSLPGCPVLMPKFRMVAMRRSRRSMDRS